MNNNRKNNVFYNAITNVITCGIIIICFIILPGIAGWFDTHYTMNCEVDNVDGEVITVIDQTGNLWDFCGDDFHRGDRVKVTFFNNTTDSTRYDDEIIKVEKK